ncbi:unnamed protein product [Parajaminaea phylloscopi]
MAEASAATVRRLAQLRSRGLLDKFQASVRPQSAHSAFHPHKSPSSGRWAPPKYSMRRQAELVNAAYATGQLDLIPESPKKSKVLDRIKAAAAAAAASSSSSSAPQASTSSLASPAPSSSSSSSSLSSTSGSTRPHHQEGATSSTTPLSPALFRTTPTPEGRDYYTNKEIGLHQRTIIRKLANAKGPYMGKANQFAKKSGLRAVFKGTREERGRVGRAKAIEEKMDEMDERVADWKSEKAASRAKARPSQPF